MFTVVDVNGLNGSLSWGMNQHGGELMYRTGLYDLGRVIVNANAKLWGADWDDHIDTTSGHAWESWYKDDRNADVVVAVPPCSGFSLLTGKGLARGTGNAVNASIDHPMNECMWSSARYAARHAPEVYVFESVTGAYSRGRDMMFELRSQIEEISGERYTLTHWLHDCAVLGAPTSRQRYMFICTKGDRPFAVTPWEEYAAEHVTTMADAIGDLESLPTMIGEQRIKRPAQAGPFGRSLHRVDGRVDGHWNATDDRAARGLTPPKWHRTVSSICDELAAGGFPWREGQTEPDALRTLYQTRGDSVHRQIQGDKRTDRFVSNDWNMGSYFATRAVWNAGCGVISGSGGDSFVHPHLDRLLTHRECARIQGWPDEVLIDFDKAFGKEKITAVWGKAVTPVVAKHAAQEISEWLRRETNDKNIGELIGEDEYLIDDLEPSRRLRRDNQLRRKAAAALETV
jgi:site-specific DNA-cytosine methylase